LKIRILLLGLLVFLMMESVAQRKRPLSCTQILNDAEDAYDEGNLDEVIDALDGADCFKKVKADPFSSEETIRAYRILTLAYLFTDNEPSAEVALVGLLNADPEHPTNEREDPAEFIYLYSKYRVLPIFRLGLKFGINQSSVRSLGITTYGTFNTASVSKRYAPKIGFMAEATFEYQLKNWFKNFEAVLGAGYYSQSYEVGFTLIPATTNSETGNEVSPVETLLKETQTWLKAPLMLRFVLPIKNPIWSPYIYGGASFDYLIGANMSGERTGDIPRDVDQSDLLSYDMRNQINRSYFGGVGVKRRSKTNYFIAELRYGIGADNFVDPANRYNNENLLFDQVHVDDDLAIDNITISVGYVHSIYKPIKYSEKKMAKRSSKN